MAHRPTLRDPALERRFRRDGYVVAAAADPDEVAAALEVFRAHPSGIEQGYYASIHSTDAAYKRQVDAGLSKVLWPKLDALLADFRPLVAAFMVKEPGAPAIVPVHQDWNTRVEDDGAGITCWIPLTPVTELEGRFRLLPGSHQYLQRLRGSPGFPAPFEHISQEIADELMIDVEVGVGEVMVMDGRVLHTTPDNRSGRTRVAAYINALPSEVPSVHYYKRDDGSVERYAVDEAFYTSFNIGEQPPGEPIEVIAPYEEPALSLEEIRRRHRRQRGIRGRLSVLR
ncbi:MAG: phytanoyl-CoA dioxygenase family protein [Acidimicrobiales bacterium]